MATKNAPVEPVEQDEAVVLPAPAPDPATAPPADGFNAPNPYVAATIGGSDHLDYADPDD